MQWHFKKLKYVGIIKLDLQNYNNNKINPKTHDVATLALGLQPSQGFAKVWAKTELGSHISCSQECKRV
jgi:hypothetical protein